MRGIQCGALLLFVTLLTSVPRQCDAQKIEIIGDRSVIDYIRNAHKSLEESPQALRGRLRATLLQRLGRPKNKTEGTNTVSMIDAVWVGQSSHRRVQRFTVPADSGNQVNIKDFEAKKPDMLEEFLFTPDQIVRAYSVPLHSDRKSVQIWPGGAELQLFRDATVLPGGACEKIFFQIKMTDLLREGGPDASGPDRRVEVTEDGEMTTIRGDVRSIGASLEVAFSKKWGDRVVRYKDQTSNDASGIKQSGSMEWASDAHGVTYLKSHEFRVTSVDNNPDQTSYIKFEVVEFDSEPVVGSDELTFKGLNLPDEAQVDYYGKDPHLPVSRGRVKDSPPAGDEKNKNAIIEQIKSRGFARPDRAK